MAFFCCIYNVRWWCEEGDSNPYTIAGVRT